MENPLRFNLLAYDPDGDSLGYELIAPLHADAQKVLQSAPGFTVPEGFTINRFGEVHWENPDKVGEYAFAVAITQYRKGRKVGHTIFDMQFLVLADQLAFPEIKLENREELTFLKDGRLLVKPGELVTLRLFFPQAAVTSWVSELQELGLKDLSFRSISSFVSEFTFTAPEALSRRQAYGINFNFAFRNPGTPYLPQIYGATLPVSILIWQPVALELMLQEADSLPLTPEGHISSEPGAAVKLLLFAKNGLGHDTELTVESDLSKNADLFSFVTRDSSNSKVGELIFRPSVDQVSTTPYTIKIRSSSIQGLTDASGSGSEELVLRVLVSASTPMSSGEVADDADVLVYPNPAQQLIKIRTPQAASTFTLYAADGQVVYRAQLISGDNFIWRPAKLKSGLYTYTVGDGRQLSARGKLLLH